MCLFEVEGYIAARATEGSFDGQEFYDFVVEEVVSLHSIFLCLSGLLLVLASPHDAIPSRKGRQKEKADTKTAKKEKKKSKKASDAPPEDEDLEAILDKVIFIAQCP